MARPGGTGRARRGWLSPFCPHLSPYGDATSWVVKWLSQYKGFVAGWVCDAFGRLDVFKSRALYANPVAQALEPVQQNGTINVETTQMTIRKRFTQSPLTGAAADEGLGLAGLQILNMMRGTYRRALPYFIRPALAIDVEKLLRERFKANPHMEWEAVEQLLLKGLIHHPIRRDWETTLTQVRADRENLKTWLVSRKATQTTMVHNLYAPPTSDEIHAITGKAGFAIDKDLSATNNGGAPARNRRVRALVAYLQRVRHALHLSHLKLALGQASANEKTILRVPDEDSP